MGLILGLTLLTANLRGIFETFFVYLLFFWERKSMRALLKKNLMAHKATNKLTSIIYALTLGCVIFLCVSLNLLLKSVQNYGVMPDSDITVYVDKSTGSMADWDILASMVDPTIEKYQDQIKDWSYVTIDLWSISDEYRSQDHSDTAQ